MTKYSKLHGTCSLHIFLFTEDPTANGTVIAKVRTSCYTGSFENANIYVINGKKASVPFPDPESKNYTSLGKMWFLSDSKRKIWNKFRVGGGHKAIMRYFY